MKGEILDERFNREKLIDNGIVSVDDLSVNTYVRKNKLKLLAVASYMSNKIPLNVCLVKAGVTKVSYNRVKNTSRKLQEYADLIGIDIEETEYADLIYINSQIELATAENSVWLYDIAKEYIYEKLDDDGNKARNAATMKDLFLLGKKLGIIESDSEDKSVESIDITIGSDRLKINTIDVVSNDLAISKAPDMQKELRDQNTKSISKIIDNMRNGG